MRILLHGFSDTEAISRATIDVLNRAREVEVVGWVARPRFNWVQDLAGCPVFDEPLPRGDRPVSLRAEPRLGLGDALVGENLRYLLDREEHFRDEYEVTLRRSEVLCWGQEILASTAPDVVLFSDVPHSALGYSLDVAASARSTRTLHFRYGPAPHLFAFADAIGAPLVDFVHAGADGTESASAFSRAYVERLAGSYEAAQPAYMRSQTARHALLSRVTRSALERPQQLFRPDGIAKARAQLQRRRLRREYEARAVPMPHGDAVIAQFLHLQPERSTVPEGGFFAQQWLIAHAIAHHLPEGWTLAVREHPSTFAPGPRIVRSPGFYDALLQIPGVQLVSLDTNPFAIVDGAVAVATVTGSVGLESIARGTPVLVFGDASYRGCHGVLDVAESGNLPSHIDVIRQGIAVGPKDVLRLLATFEASRRVFVCDTHGDDVNAIVATGIAHAGVVERMVEYLQNS